MIIEKQEDVTRKVLEEMHRTPDARTKEILAALVTHLHAFVREFALPRPSSRRRSATSTPSVRRPRRATTRRCCSRERSGFRTSCACSTTGTRPRRTTSGRSSATVRRAARTAPRCCARRRPARRSSSRAGCATAGKPVAGAEVDVWHSSTVGLYENQDPTQADMNLRGRFTTAADGSFGFRSVKPAGYPVPTDGPTGALLAAQRRHNMRPAHLHFLIYKPGFKTIASQVYDPEDPHLETDSQFGVTRRADRRLRQARRRLLRARVHVRAGAGRGAPAEAPITGKAGPAGKTA